jgi:hypothetical protein
MTIKFDDAHSSFMKGNAIADWRFEIPGNSIVDNWIFWAFKPDSLRDLSENAIKDDFGCE